MSTQKLPRKVYHLVGYNAVFSRQTFISTRLHGFTSREVVFFTDSVFIYHEHVGGV
jgi:hypothetical protein